MVIPFKWRKSYPDQKHLLRVSLGRREEDALVISGLGRLLPYSEGQSFPTMRRTLVLGEGNGNCLKLAWWGSVGRLQFSPLVTRVKEVD
ncbi:hypothetical protein AAG906_009824 [Vitis piasezkii]